MPFLELPSVADQNDQNARIYYELSGASYLPVLVLSNSLGVNLSMWDAQMTALSAHYRVLRYDGRGQGRSSITPGMTPGIAPGIAPGITPVAYSMAQLSRDVLALLDKLGVDRAHFCGLSMGGMIGQALGSSAAGRLDKLVLANTAAKIGDAESWNARIRAVRQGGMRPMIAPALERWFTPRFRAHAPDTVAHFANMLEAAEPEGYAANCAAVRDFDGRTSADSIRVPTLIVAGADDAATPPAEGRFLADRIPGAQYIELEAAHLSNVEASGAFTAGVLRFLRA